MQSKFYPIMVHKIRKLAVDIISILKAIEALVFQNRSLHPGLNIRRIAWPKAALKLEKQAESIILKLGNTKEANAVIKKGLIEEYNVKTCELFDKNCRIT